MQKMFFTNRISEGEGRECILAKYAQESYREGAKAQG